MTAQVSDPILFEGRWFALACEPLGPWLDRRKSQPLRFKRTHTACWRGYNSEWKIERGRLFLTRFSARLANGRYAGLPTLFHNCCEQFLNESGAYDPANQGPGRFAFWVTGIVDCHVGKLMRYKHTGYASRHEATLRLDFDAGFLIGQSIIRHDIVGKGFPDDDVFADLCEAGEE